MALDAYTVSITLLRNLSPLLKRLSARDPKLEDQARRAAMSVSLNIAEASERAGKDQRNRIASVSRAPPRSVPRSMSPSHSATSAMTTRWKCACSSTAFAR
jgi:hypothetical protein